MDWVGNITEKRYRIHVMLEDVDLDQSLISSVMNSSTETKDIDRIIEVREHFLHHNEKDKPMYGAIPEGCDDVKKMMGEVLSLLTGNGLCNLICKLA